MAACRLRPARRNTASAHQATLILERVRQLYRFAMVFVYSDIPVGNDDRPAAPRSISLDLMGWPDRLPVVRSLAPPSGKPAMIPDRFIAIGRPLRCLAAGGRFDFGYRFSAVLHGPKLDHHFNPQTCPHLSPLSLPLRNRRPFCRPALGIYRNIGSRLLVAQLRSF